MVLKSNVLQLVAEVLTWMIAWLTCVKHQVKQSNNNNNNETLFQLPGNIVKHSILKQTNY